MVQQKKIEPFWIYEWTPESISSFWNIAAQSPLMNKSFSKLHGQSLVSLIKKFVEVTKKICDFGAGSGDLISLLLQNGYHAGAFEPSKNRCSDFPHAVLKHPHFLGFNTNTRYDCVLCFEVLEHIHNNNLDESLNTIQAMLKKDGILFGSVPYSENLEDNYCICPHCKAMFHKWQHMRSFTPEQIYKFLEHYNFTDIKILATKFTDSVFFVAKHNGVIRKGDSRENTV